YQPYKYQCVAQSTLVVEVYPATGIATPMVVSGANHTLALKADGTVWAWGNNYYGQLGIAASVNRDNRKKDTEWQYYSPYDHCDCIGNAGLDTYHVGYAQNNSHQHVSSCPGSRHICELTYYSRYWTTATDAQGRDILKDYSTPQRVVGWESTNNGNGYSSSAQSDGEGLSNIVRIFAGENTSYALDMDGQLYAWGYNANGELGNGNWDYTYEYDAIPCHHHRSYTASHYCYCHGYYNYWGNWVAGYHSWTYFVQDTSQGENGCHVLKWAATRDSSAYSPVKVLAPGTTVNFTGTERSGNHWTTGSYVNNSRSSYLNDVVTMAAGRDFAIALLKDGSVVYWGNSGGYQSKEYMEVEHRREAPFQRTVSYDEGEYAPSPWGTAEHTLRTFSLMARAGDTRPGEWHETTVNSHCAYGTSYDQRYGYQGVSGSCDFTKYNETEPDASAGVAGNYVTKLTPVYVIGVNGTGRLGDNALNDTLDNGSVDRTTSPLAKTQNSSLSAANYTPKIIKLAAGDYYAVALTSSGTVYAWGMNTAGSGATHNVSNNDRRSPNTSTGHVDAPGYSGHTYRTAIYQGAPNRDYINWTPSSNPGYTPSWDGWGAMGQGNDFQGNNESFDRLYPTQVKSGEQMTSTNYLQDIVDIASGDKHILALDAHGQVWAWGDNSKGQLGDGTTTDRNQPTKVKYSGLGDGQIEIVRIFAFGDMSAGIDRAGHVYAWGDNTWTEYKDSGTWSGASKANGPSYVVSGTYTGKLGVAGVSTINELSVANRVKAGESIESGVAGNERNTKDDFIGAQSVALSLNHTTIYKDQTPVRDADGKATQAPYITNNVYAMGDAVGLGNGRSVDYASVPAMVGEPDQQSIYIRQVIQVHNIQGLDEEEGKEKAGTTTTIELDGELRSYILGRDSDSTLSVKVQVPEYLNPSRIRLTEGDALRIPMIYSAADGAQANLLHQFTAGTNLYRTSGVDPKGDNVFCFNSTEIIGTKDLDEGVSHKADPVLPTVDLFQVISTDESILKVYKYVDAADATKSYFELRTMPNAFGEVTVLIRETATQASRTFTVTVKPKDYDLTEDPNDKLAVPKVVYGEDFAVALKSDGTVWAWGANDFGQLGDGSTGYEYSPVQVRNVNGNGYLMGIVDIMAGGFTVFAEDADGNWYVWGQNYLYQAGNGDCTHYVYPTGLNIVAEDGYIINRNGNPEWLDVEDADPKDVPVHNIAQLSAGWLTTLIATKNGRAYGVGLNNNRQINLRATGNSAIDYPGNSMGVHGGTMGSSVVVTATRIERGGYINNVEKSGARVRDGVSSLSSTGKLGRKDSPNANGFTSQGFTATATNESIYSTAIIDNVESVYAGRNYSLIRTVGGQVFAWGNLATDVNSPQWDIGETGVNQSNYGKAWYRSSGGTLPWYENLRGMSSTYDERCTYQYWNGSYDGSGNKVYSTVNQPIQRRPILVREGSEVNGAGNYLRDVVQVANSYVSQYWSGTSNDSGKIYNTISESHVLMLGMNSVYSEARAEGGWWATDLPGDAENGYTAMTTDKSGVVFGMGGNSSYEITANSSSSHIGRPVVVKNGDGVRLDQALEDGDRIVQVAVGGNRSGVLTQRGDVYEWGGGTAGTRRLAAEATGAKPTSITSYQDTGKDYWDNTPGKYKQTYGYAMSTLGSVVLKSDGTLWAWGLNEDGQLGIGSTNLALRQSIDNPGEVYYGQDTMEKLSLNTVTVGVARASDGQLDATAPSYVVHRPWSIDLMVHERQTFQIDVNDVAITRVNSFNVVANAVWYSNIYVNADATDEKKKRLLKFQSANPELLYFKDNTSGLATVNYDKILPGMYTYVTVSDPDRPEYSVRIRVNFYNDILTYNDTTSGTSYNALGMKVGDDWVGEERYVHHTSMPTIITGDNFTFALKPDGTVWAWGNYTNGFLASDIDGEHVIVPTQVQDPDDPTGYLTGITQMVGNENFMLFLKSEGVQTKDGEKMIGKVYAWGANTYGRFGNGASGDTVLIDAENKGLVATRIDSTLYSIPSQNFNGNPLIRLGEEQLFDGAYKTFDGSYKTVPGTYAPVSTSKENEPLVTLSKHLDTTERAFYYYEDSYINYVIKLAAGRNHAVALTQNGTIYAWGLNDHSQVTRAKGSMFSGSVLSAHRLKAANMVDVAAGSNHTLLLRSDGTVWAYGSNTNGQVGVGTTTATYYDPTQVVTTDGQPLRGVVEIAAGDNFSLALDEKGQVWVWGLMNGTNQTRALKLSFGENERIIRMEAKQNIATFITDGSAVTYRWNSVSTTAAPTADNRLRAGQAYKSTSDPDDSAASVLTDTFMAVSHSSHTVVVTKDGAMYAYGNDTTGAMGDKDGTAWNSSSRNKWSQTVDGESINYLYRITGDRYGLTP
ncbi:MAG: hypothetical protein NC311_13900, partial [Muribaculaceae bacterium]|nr:hypothetical protein [Muribaculaceae bacterium]